MPTWLQWTLIVAGLAVTALLLIFIGRQLGALKQERNRRRKQEEFQQRRRHDIVESLHILALAIEQDQVEYSEACLRIKGLLDLIAPDLLKLPHYRVFLEVHEQLRHMPTHQARKNTDKRFIHKMDQERFAVESRHAEAIRQAAKALRQHQF